MNVAHKKLRIVFVIALMLIVSTTPFALKPVAAQTSGYYDKCFTWDYSGKHWNWNLSIPADLYDAYKFVSVSTRTKNGPSGYGFLTTTDDAYVKMLANKLNETTNTLGYSPYDKVSFVLAFVQSLPYTSDKVTSGSDEYPRFPIETLVDDGGDCEDTSILFATITLIMGYGTVYINPPDHYAVGVLGDNLKGTYWEYPDGSGNKYYYCETTGDGFTIGLLPDQFASQNAYIYPIDESIQYVPNVVVTLPTDEPTSTKVPLIGTSPPTPTSNPDDQNPTVQTPKPLSFNLIEDNPLISFVIIIVIVFCVTLAIWSARRPKHQGEPILEPATPPTPTVQEVSMQTDAEVDKFCIYCGSQNRGYAAYCEKCGKQLD